MSGFTVGVAILGGLVLAVLVAWNAWTTRRNAPRQAVAVAAPPSAMPVEPAEERAEPVLEDEPLAPLPVPERKPRLDPLIDVIAAIAVDVPVSGEAAIAALPPTRRAGSKPFAIEGRSEAAGEWETPRAGQRYDAFQAGVQLANRNGALNEIEFSEFVQKLEAFAQAIGASTDLPDMLETVARARELDAFASQHDAQLVALLRASSVAWSVGYLQQIAQRHGFVPGAVPGRLVLPAVEDGAPPVLVLGFDAQAALADDPGHAAVRELTLGLDVAQTEELAEPFAAWHGIARKLADDLDAAIVDDQGQLITLHAFSAIHAELTRLYEALMAHDLAAGSPGARRLFS